MERNGSIIMEDKGILGLNRSVTSLIAFFSMHLGVSLSLKVVFDYIVKEQSFSQNILILLVVSGLLECVTYSRSIIYHGFRIINFFIAFIWFSFKVILPIAFIFYTNKYFGKIIFLNVFFLLPDILRIFHNFFLYDRKNPKLVKVLRVTTIAFFFHLVIVYSVIVGFSVFIYKLWWIFMVFFVKFFCPCLFYNMRYEGDGFDDKKDDEDKKDQGDNKNDSLE